jgi:hypothetical protein
VEHDVVQIHEHPLAIARAFDSIGAISRRLGFFDDSVCDGADVPV